MGLLKGLSPPPFANTLTATDLRAEGVGFHGDALTVKLLAWLELEKTLVGLGLRAGPCFGLCNDKDVGELLESSNRICMASNVRVLMNC